MSRSGTLTDGRPRSDIVTPGGNLRLWVGSATTAGGVATFFPTTDNTISGEGVFSEVLHAIPTAQANVTLATDVPIASVKTLTPRAVTVNCIAGAIAAPDGTVVHCLVVGT